MDSSLLSFIYQHVKEPFKDMYRKHKTKQQIETELNLLFVFIKDPDRTKYLIQKIMHTVDKYRQNKLYDVLKAKLTEILSCPEFEIEEGDQKKRVDDILKILEKYFEDIRESAKEEKADNNHNQIIKQVRYTAQQVEVIKENTSSKYETIAQIDARLKYESTNKLSLSFFDFQDPIFKSNLFQAIERNEAVFNIVCVSTKEEALYYTLFLLREKHLEDRVLIISCIEDWNKIDPDPDKILIAYFEKSLSANIHNYCINIRVLGGEYCPDLAKDIVLPMRNKYNLRRALMVIYNDDMYEVDQLIEKTKGYYPLIAAQLISPNMYYSWQDASYEDLEYLEQILFLEEFSSSDFETINRLGYDIKKILSYADRLNNAKPNCIPIYRQHTKTINNGEHIILYQVISPELLWNFCYNRECDFFKHFKSYLDIIFANLEAIGARQIQQAIYSVIRNRGRLSEDFSNLKDVIPNALENVSFLKEILPAITELNSQWTLDWFYRNHEEICDDNAYSIALLMKAQETSSKMIDLILEILDERKTSERRNFPCLFDIAGEIFRLHKKTTPLSINSLIEKINRIKCIPLFLDVFHENILAKKGIQWTNVFTNFKYLPMDVDFREKRSINDILKLHNAIVYWYLEHSDFDHLLLFLRKVPILTDIDHFIIEQAINRVCLGESVNRLLEMKSVLLSLCIEYKKDTPELSKALFNLLGQLLPNNKLAKILPLFSFECHFDLCKEWEIGFSPEEEELFSEHIIRLIKEHNLTSAEYLEGTEFIDDIEYSRYQYIKVFFKAFNYKSISSEQIVKMPIIVRSGFMEHLWEIDSKYLITLFRTIDKKNLGEILKAAYPEIALAILPLVDTAAYQRYWTEYRSNCRSTNKNTLSVYITNLKEAGNIEGILCFFKANYLVMNHEMILDILTFLDGTKQSIDKKDIPHLCFDNLRNASENGFIPFLTVSDLEIKFLTPENLCRDDTFFFRRINEDPALYSKIVAEANTNSNKGIDYKGIFIRIRFCPGKTIDGKINERDLEYWISSFISSMKDINREDLISQGLAQILSWSVSDFDDILPDSICRMIEHYSCLIDEINNSEENSLISDLHIAIHNRRGSHISDRGESAIQISNKFYSFYNNCSSKGFNQTANLYKSLSQVFKWHAELERDNEYY